MKPSVALGLHRDQVREILARFRLGNPRVFGSAARGDDIEGSDLDILIDAPSGTSYYDLAGAEIELEAVLGCKVDLVTPGGLAPDVAKRVQADVRPV
jgi:predicted nucleotidyltransferase